VSLTTGRGPLSAKPAGVFNSALPDALVYVEPFRRRVRATYEGQTVVDSERSVLVHRQGQAPTFALPAGDVSGVPSVAVAEIDGYVVVAWDAVDAWFEEGDQIFMHPRNPYHRIDCLRTTRRLRVEVAGVVLVDSTDTTILY
jgi:uncharacterized protein (DUF427 family)